MGSCNCWTGGIGMGNGSTLDMKPGQGYLPGSSPPGETGLAGESRIRKRGATACDPPGKRLPGAGRLSGEHAMSARMNGSGTVTRRDRFGVHSIGEFVLAVPDLQAAERYYGTFGLKMESAGNALALKTPGDGYRWGRIIAGPKKQLHHITFHCFEEDLARFRAHLGANRVDAVAPPPGVPDDGLWFQDHDGLLVEI